MMVNKEKRQTRREIIRGIADVAGISACAFAFFNLPVSVETMPALLLAAGVGVATKMGLGIAGIGGILAGGGLAIGLGKGSKKIINDHKNNSDPDNIEQTKSIFCRVAETLNNNGRLVSNSAIYGVGLIAGMAGAYMAYATSMEYANDFINENSPQIQNEESSKIEIKPLEGQKVSKNRQTYKLTFS